MADNRFRLFRLPLLALCKILDFYSPRDIIHLSFCSKRSLRIAKKCWKKKGKITADLSADISATIKIHFYNPLFYYRFVISNVQDLQHEQVHNIQICGAVVPCVLQDTETITFWKDKIFGIGQIVRYIKDLFGVPITCIDFNFQRYKNEFIDTMDCIINLQESVADCALDTFDPIEKCLTHLLDNNKVTGNLGILGKLNTKFKNNWNIHLDSLDISYSSCLTFQNLINIDCQFLELRRSSLTSKDANLFLKHWQKGGSCRIRYAFFAINSLNYNIVTSGIETVPQPETLRRVFPYMFNVEITRRGGLDIQRNDGTTGTVYLTDNSFSFGVDPTEVFGDRENI